MRVSTLLSSIGAPVLCLSIVFAAYGSVSADGIKSQWKNRLPQGAPISDTLVSGTISVIATEAALSPREREAIATIVRRNARAQERRNKIATEDVKPVVVKPTSPTTDRARQAVKLYRSAAAKCSDLHTHERSQCMYLAQLEAGRNVQGVNQ